MESPSSEALEDHSSSSSTGAETARKHWTMIEDYYLLEGYLKYPRKFNLVKEYIQQIGHLDFSRTESSIADRLKNLMKKKNPYEGDFPRKKFKKPVALDPNQHADLIRNLEINFQTAEHQNEQLFLAVKNFLRKVRDRTQKVVTETDIASRNGKLEDEIDEIEASLMAQGQNRQEERESKKSKLVSVVELDTASRQENNQRMARMEERLDKSAQQIDTLLSLLGELVNLKKRKLERELEGN